MFGTVNLMRDLLWLGVLLMACGEAGHAASPPDVRPGIEGGDGRPMAMAATDASSDVVPQGGVDDDGGHADAAPVASSDAAATVASSDAATASPDDYGCGNLPAGTLVEIPLVARALVADRVRHRLYASISSSSKMYPNRLVTLDPANGDVLDSVTIGDDPTTLAMSDDSSTLWAGLSGTREIRKIDLTGPTPVPGAKYALPGGDMNAMAGSMTVLPGTRGSVAISLSDSNSSPPFAGAIVLDEGVPRSTQPFGGAGLDVMTGGPAGFLYGMDLTTIPMFYTVTVDATGLAVLDARSTFVRFAGATSNAVSDLVYDTDGYVYASTGEVIDVSHPNAARRAGTFDFSGAIASVPGSPVALMLSLVDGGVLQFRILDTATFTQMASRRVGDSTRVFNGVRSHVAYVGPHCLGFIDDESLANGTTSVDVLHDDLAISAPNPVEPATTTQNGLTEVPLAAEALVVDRSRHRLYATVGGGANAYANRLVTINADDAKILHSVAIGSDPVALAMSDDSSVLWVSLAGSYEIRKVDLTTQFPTPGPSLTLPRTSSADLAMAAASSLRVLSDGNGSVAAAMYFTDHRTPIFAGDVVVDNGVPRALGVTRNIGPSQLLAGPPGYLFGLGDGGFYTLTIDSRGIAVGQELNNISYAYPYGAYDTDGFVYSASGEVVDVRTPSAPQILGRFPFTGAVLPVPGSATVFMISTSANGSDGPLSFLVLDSNARTQVSSQGLSAKGQVFEPVRELLRVGPGRVAFIGRRKQPDVQTSLYLLNAAAVP